MSERFASCAVPRYIAPVLRSFGCVQPKPG